MIINNNNIYIIDFNRFNYEDNIRFYPHVCFYQGESIELQKANLKAILKSISSRILAEIKALFSIFKSIFNFMGKIVQMKKLKQ